MFEFVHKHKRWMQGVLLILIVPSFALFGINFYFQDSGTEGALATVGAVKISEVEYAKALRQTQDRMRQMMREAPNPEMFNSPQFKESVLNDLIEQKVTLAHAYAAGLTVADRELQKVISEVEAFRDESGKFSRERYRQLLQGQDMSPLEFENQLRSNLMLEQVRSAYSTSGLVTDAMADRLLRIREQERRISQVEMQPASYRARVKIEAAQVEKSYTEHKAEFQIPERVKVEYLMLSLSGVERETVLSDQEIETFYKENISRYQAAEERRASHILIPAGTSASAGEKAAAKAQAEDLLKQIKAQPKKFGELAILHSKDPGSAEKGGDLGFFGRGLMVKPFDDAAFALKVGELAGPVETQYGFHIIRMDAIKSGATEALAKVRDQIESELRKTKASKTFAQAAETFGESVYAQFDSLQPAADALKLPIFKSDWISRTGGNQNPLLNNEKLLAVLFSEEVLKNKHNTPAVEVQSSVLISARVFEHKPSESLPLDQVKEDIIRQLTEQEAARLAEADGRAVLEKLRAGESPALKWSPGLTVTLQKRQGLHPEAAQAVFGAPVDKLPAFAGVPTPNGGFVVYRISEVRNLEKTEPEQIKALRQQLSQMSGQEQYIAFLAALRERADVKLDKKKLDGDS